ncbi:Isoaspartyl peptidase/L-asparaginase [Holothuria leucospilota]|uniref:Isoaspartyl peptidase/L-asparaginase n=1 Tax=Holothuria leucospilota TaxID=206669 RepID=A0A9Q1CIH1_HOLLE|nr:Isoaspartyl peptidase/L-asparaginase [Holothuria leucospilota]
MTEIKPTILIHGGAWAIPDHLVKDSVDGAKDAAKAGYTVLRKETGSALDAVEAAVCCLEDNPAFDAGTGAVLNQAGEVELDAIIMEGKELRTGCVACVQNIKHPVNLARHVMEKVSFSSQPWISQDDPAFITLRGEYQRLRLKHHFMRPRPSSRQDHVMLVGQGANLFAKEMGIQEVPTSELVTPEAVRYWEEYSKYKVAVKDLFNNKIIANEGHDTVGAVAIDRHGNVACATSTGGITGKRVGRVGDSPIIGSGAYCDNNIGAVSTTGHGESIMKVMLARLVLQYIEQGLSTQNAAEKALQFMEKRVGGAGGVIAVNKEGEIGKHLTTERMVWAALREDQLTYGIEPKDNFSEMLSGS